MPIVKVTLQRWYAYAVFLLRDVFLASPNNRRYEWKARTTMLLSQGFLAIAAAEMAMITSGWYLPLRYPAASVFGCAMLGLALFPVNSTAERRLLPRFEHEFQQLSKPRRIIGRVGVVLYVALTAAAFLGSAAAVHAHLCSSGTARTGVSVTC